MNFGIFVCPGVRVLCRKVSHITAITVCAAANNFGYLHRLDSENQRVQNELGFKDGDIF